MLEELHSVAGWRRGCIHSPALFKLFIDDALKAIGVFFLAFQSVQDVIIPVYMYQ
jgi:hypothetical protein